MIKFFCALPLAASLTACIPNDGVDRRPHAQPAAPSPDNGPAPPRLDADSVALVDHDPPWVVRPVVANATTVQAQNYIVQPGDTLRGVGNRTGAGSEMIAKANRLTAPYLLRPGQTLTIPAGRYHLVAVGETGIAIAQAYGVDWGRMVELNGLVEPYALRRGQRLMLPANAPLRAPTMEERAAAFRIDIDDVLTGGEPATAEGKAVAAAPTKPKALAPTMPIVQPGAFTGTFAWPLTGKVMARFGPGASGERNNGIDIASPIGTPIRASAGGVVAYAGNQVSVFGGLVLINHGSGWVTAYGYASRVDVVRGQKVTRGQVIGATGDTGYASRPLLHFEIRKDRKPVDPQSLLPGR